MVFKLMILGGLVAVAVARPGEPAVSHAEVHRYPTHEHVVHVEGHHHMHHAPEHHKTVIHHEVPMHHHEVHHHHHEAAAPAHHGHGEHHHEHHVDYHAEPHYTFEYGVHDPHTGDVKEHKESRKDDAVNGFYSLHEADGTKRTVHYTANKHDGFNAVVKTEGHAHHEMHHY